MSKSKSYLCSKLLNLASKSFSIGWWRHWCIAINNSLIFPKVVSVIKLYYAILSSHAITVISYKFKLRKKIRQLWNFIMCNENIQIILPYWELFNQVFSHVFNYSGKIFFLFYLTTSVGKVGINKLIVERKWKFPA